MLSEDAKNFINSAVYKEIDRQMRDIADRLFALTMADETLPFTEKLMKEYAHKKAKEAYLKALDNIINLTIQKEFKKVSWK
jgi:hypothetical protein